MLSSNSTFKSFPAHTGPQGTWWPRGEWGQVCHLCQLPCPSVSSSPALPGAASIAYLCAHASKKLTLITLTLSPPPRVRSPSSQSSEEMWQHFLETCITSGLYCTVIHAAKQNCSLSQSNLRSNSAPDNFWLWHLIFISLSFCFLIWEKEK